MDDSEISNSEIDRRMREWVEARRNKVFETDKEREDFHFLSSLLNPRLPPGVNTLEEYVNSPNLVPRDSNKGEAWSVQDTALMWGLRSGEHPTSYRVLEKFLGRTGQACRLRYMKARIEILEKLGISTKEAKTGSEERPLPSGSAGGKKRGKKQKRDDDDDDDDGAESRPSRRRRRESPPADPTSEAHDGNEGDDLDPHLEAARTLLQLAGNPAAASDGGSRPPPLPSLSLSSSASNPRPPVILPDPRLPSFPSYLRSLLQGGPPYPPPVAPPAARETQAPIALPSFEDLVRAASMSDDIDDTENTGA